MNSFELKGLWWLPENPNQQVNGVLKYTKEEGIFLDLFGVLGEKTKYDIINGELEDNKFATLYNSFCTQISYSSLGYGVTKVLCNFCFIGEDIIDKISKLKFDRAIIYLKDMKEWVNMRNAFCVNRDNSKTINIKYETPKDISVNVGKTMNISIGFAGVINGQSPMFNNVSIEQKVYFKLDYSRKKNFDKILEDTSHLEQFLTICTQRATYPLDFLLYQKDSNNKYTLKYQVYYHIRYSEPLKEIKLPYDLLVQYRYIKDIFDDVLNNWFSSQQKLKSCLVPFFNNYYSGTLYASDKFLNICRSIEAFHRETVGLIDSSTRRKYYYKKRVLEVFKSVSSCCNNLLKIRDKDIFAEKTKAYRNDFTHSNSSLFEKSDRYIKTHYITEKLNIILICSLLHYHGIPKSRIKKMLNETTLYTHIRYKIK